MLSIEVTFSTEEEEEEEEEEEGQEEEDDEEEIEPDMDEAQSIDAFHESLADLNVQTNIKITVVDKMVYFSLSLSLSHTHTHFHTIFFFAHDIDLFEQLRRTRS